MSTEIIHGYWLKKVNGTSEVLMNIDFWSNKQMCSYIGITVHFISNEKLHMLCCACIRSEGHHTAENIVTQCRDIISNLNY